MKENANIVALLWKTALLFLVVYLLLSLRLAPFGDEAWDWAMADRGVYMAAGRPGLAAYLSLFAGHGVPYAYCVAAAVFFAAAVCIQVLLLNIEDAVSRFVYVAVQLGIVQFSYAMIDCYQADAVMLGVFLVSAAFWFVVKGGWWSMAAAVLCAAMAASVYQLIIMIVPVLYFVYVLRTREDGDMGAHIFCGIKAAGVCICAVLLYWGVQFACKCSLSQGVIDSVNAYQDSLMTWGQLDVVTHVLHIGKQWCMHLVGVGYPGEYLYATTLVPVLMLTADILRNGQKPLAQKLFYGVIPAVVYVLPFLPLAVMGEDRGARLYLSETLACAGLWAVLIQQRGWNCKPAASMLTCALSAAVILKACYTVSEMAFYQHRIYIQNQTAYKDLQQRIAQVENREGVETGSAPVVISGQWQSELRARDRYSSCIINPSEFYFYSFIGKHNVRRPQDSAIPQEELQRILETMPAWPEPGSVRYHQGEILVKFALHASPSK